MHESNLGIIDNRKKNVRDYGTEHNGGGIIKYHEWMVILDITSALPIKLVTGDITIKANFNLFSSNGIYSLNTFRIIAQVRGEKPFYTEPVKRLRHHKSRDMIIKPCAPDRA